MENVKTRLIIIFLVQQQPTRDVKIIFDEIQTPLIEHTPSVTRKEKEFDCFEKMKLNTQMRL